MLNIEHRYAQNCASACANLSTGGGVLFESAKAKAETLVRRSREKWDADEIGALLQAAEAHKPAGYDRHHATVERLYRGQQIETLKIALRQRYEITGVDMSPLAINILRTSAHLDAQAYRRAPERHLEVNGERPGTTRVDVDGAPMPVAPQHAERAERFRALVGLARLGLIMPEADRRCMASGTIFLRPSWPVALPRLARRQSRPRIDLYWPHQVQVIPHPDAPGDLWACLAAMFSVAGPSTDKGEAWHLIFWRDDVGGPIQVQKISTKGRNAGPPETLLTRSMPCVAMHSGLSQESVFHDVDRDLVDAQNFVNVSLTNWGFKDDLQGHAERVITGTHGLKAGGPKITGGPGAAITLPPGADMKVLQYGHDLTGLDGVEKILRMFGMSRQQSPDAWASEPGPPLSGVSRIVQNIEPNSKRDENVARFAEMEELELLPLLVDLADVYGQKTLGGRIGDVAGITYHTRFAPPEQFEEPEAKRLRAQLMQGSGWISPAAAAVMGGAYRTVDEAKARGLADSLPVVGDLVAGTGAQSTAQGAAQGAAPNMAATLNELSLTIERLARVGDDEMINTIRAKIAAILGATTPQPISIEHTADDDEVVN
jgi:hypothetical protein